MSDDDRIFRDPALDAVTPSDDPLVRFAAKHWRLMLVLVAVYGAVWYGQIVYRQAQSRRADRAAEGYKRVQETFEQFLTAQRAVVAAESSAADAAKDTTGKSAEQLEGAKKSRDDARIALVEQLKIVSDQGGNYKRIAGLLGALAQNAAGERQAAESAVSSFSDWRALKPESGERILAEVAAYVRAKIRLGLPDGKTTAAGELNELASDGTFLNAAAALALASASTTDEEKTTARDVLQRVRSAHPEQTDLLNREVARLGWQ